MTMCALNHHVGAYALDALDAEESDEVRRHLTTCDSCGQQAEEFAGTIAQLNRLTLAEVEHALTLDAVAAPRIQRRANTRKALAGAAAAAVIGIAGVLAGIGPERVGPTNPVILRAANTATGVAASLRVTRVGHETQLHLALHGAYPRGTCYLLVHSRHGKPQIAATWSATSWGTADVNATTVTSPTQLTEFDVVTASGHRLIRLAMPIQNT